MGLAATHPFPALTGFINHIVVADGVLQLSFIERE